MRGCNKWSYRPYRPFLWEVGDVYVCRIAPSDRAVRIEWLGADEAEYSVFIRVRGEGEFGLCGTTRNTEFDVTGLENGIDYEMMVCAGEKKSKVRLVRCGAVPGTAVNYLHPEDKAYAFSGRALCSPSLLRHPDGYLLAAMDLFCGESPQNLTLVFRSDDEGESWHYQCELMPCFWGKLFMHRDRLYMLAVSTEYGDLLIAESTDGGKSFEAPVALLRGSNGKQGYAGVHKNPQNMLEHNGRIYGTLEWGSWLDKGYFHAAMVMSCDSDVDLLDPTNWHFTPPVKYDPEWEGTAADGSRGTIEGTLCVSPDGELFNFMRYQTRQEKKILAYRVRTDDPDLPLEYSHAVGFEGNLSKFMIKRDARSGKYYSIVCRRAGESETVRNLLSLMSSEDLSEWRLEYDLIDRRHADPQKVGFQYVDFEIEGDDVIYLCRTSENGARNYHDANYQTFHRIKNFRDTDRSAYGE